MHPYLVEGVGEDFWPETFDRDDRRPRGSRSRDRDSFLTTRRLALERGHPRRRLGRPGRPRRPDRGGRDRRPRGADGRDPPRRRALLPVEDLQRRVDDSSTASSSAAARPDGRRRPAAQDRRGRDAAAGHRADPPGASATPSRCCTSTASPSCRSSAPHDPHTIVGSIGERGLLKHAVDDPALLERRDRRRDGAAVPGRLRGGPGPRGRRAARRRAPGADGHRATAAPAGIVTRADLLEALARVSVRHPRGPRRPDAGPELRLGHPGHPPDLDLRPAARPASSSRTSTTRAAPTRRAPRSRRRSASSRAASASAFSSGMAAEHAVITDGRRGRRPRRPARRPLRRHLPPRRQGAHPLGPALRPRRPDRPRRARARRAARDEADLGRDADQPAAQRRRHRRRRRAQGPGARRGRQHVRHPGQPAAAGARRRRRRALDDQVPRRALRRRRRRRDRRATAAHHEQLRFVQNSVGAVPGPVRLLPRPPRAAHAARCGWTPTLAARAPSSRSSRAPTASATCAGRASAAWSASATPTPRGSRRATALFTLAESLGGVESLIEVPQAMTHQSVEGSAAAVPADLVRLSCGIEDPEDLVDDLRAALAP